MDKIGVQVMLVGVNRCGSVTEERIYEALVRPFVSSRFFDARVNILLIDPEGPLANPRSGEDGYADVGVSGSLARFQVETLKQSKLLSRTRQTYRNLLLVGDEWEDGGRSLRNALVFLAAMADAPISAEGESDVVIFSRPDLLLGKFRFLRLRVLAMGLANRSGRQRIMSPIWGNYGGVNDRFAIMTNGLGPLYFGRIQELENWIRTGARFHSERFLGFVLGETRVRRTIWTRMWRIRVGGLTEVSDRRRFAKPLLYQLLVRRRLFLWK